MFTHINDMVSRIKRDNPLILNITNHVTMDFVANGLLSLGASPIMTLATQEVDALVNLANAVVINIGTLNDTFIELCEQVCLAANRLGKPITLDPVGAGASPYRTQACLHLLARFNIAIIRGNASEIMSLAHAAQSTKGVDSHHDTFDAIDSAKYLASQHHAIIAISGKRDVVVNAEYVKSFDYGSSLMPQITGSGCLLSAIISAFDAVHTNHYDAVSAAVVFYGLCGERAALKADGPGTFKPYFLDALGKTIL